MNKANRKSYVHQARKDSIAAVTARASLLWKCPAGAFSGKRAIA